VLAPLLWQESPPNLRMETADQSEEKPRPLATVDGEGAATQSGAPALPAGRPIQESGPEPAKEEGGKWGEYLKTLLEIAGTGSVFIAAGYIAEIAHDELLGVNFPINRTVTDYALTGGRFFIETAARLWLHPWVSTFGVAVIAIVLFAGSLLNFKNDATRKHVQALTLFVIFLVVAWKTYRLDVPYIQMEGVLRRPPFGESFSKQAAAKGWLLFKKHDVWEKFVCGHINSAEDQWSPVLNRQFPRCSEEGSQCSGLSMGTLRDLVLPSGAHTCFSLEQEYVMDVFVTVILMLVTVLVVRSVPSSERKTRSLAGDCHAALRILMLVIVFGSVFTLPYIYGKTIESTSYPAGRIAFDSSDFQGQSRIEIADALVIWADSKFVTVYRSDTFEFLHLSRERVRYLSADSTKDIIRVYALWYSPRQTN